MAISSRAIKAGEAFVSMMLDDEQFSKSIDQWKEKFSEISKRVAPLGQAMSAAGAAMSAPFLIGFRHLLTYSKQLDFTATRLGIAGDQMAQLAAVAQLTDVSVEGLEIGLKTIGERIMQLQSNSQETAEAFKQLGIDARAFINEPNTLKRLFMMSEAFTKIEDAGLAAGLSLRALGESGNRMLIILRRGPEQLQRDMEAMKDIVADKSQLRAAQDLFIAWNKMKIAAGNLTGEMAETLVPATVELLDYMTDLARIVTNLVKQFPGLTAALGKFAVAVSLAGAALLSLNGIQFVIFRSFAAMKGAVDLVTVAFRNLIPLLITTEMHISGIGVALTPLAAGLGAVAAIAAGILVPIKYLANLTWTQTLAVGLNIVNERLATLIATLSFLPDSVRAGAQALARFLQYQMFGEEMDAPQMADMGPSTGLQGTGAPWTPRTSGIAARFASQQTMGAAVSGTSAADETAANTARMAETLNQIERNQREQAVMN